MILPAKHSVLEAQSLLFIRQISRQRLHDMPGDHPRPLQIYVFIESYDPKNKPNLESRSNADPLVCNILTFACGFIAILLDVYLRDHYGGHLVPSEDDENSLLSIPFPWAFGQWQQAGPGFLCGIGPGTPIQRDLSHSQVLRWI